MNPPAIREAGIDDVDTIMPVMTGAFDPDFGEAWNRGQCLGILTLPDVWLSIAGPADRPEGFALARKTVDEAELLLLAVLPEARGKGIGAALIDFVARQVQRRGARRLFLEARASNRALDLYARVGFQEIGRRSNYYRGTGGVMHDALTLAMPLGDSDLPPRRKNA